MRYRLKTPLLISLIISLALFLYFAYSSLKVYELFKAIDGSDKSISTIYRYSNLLKEIEYEELQSAKYLGSRGKIGFDKLKNIREIVNKKIDLLYEKNLALSKDIEYVRSRVDVLDQDINKTLFSYFDDAVKKSILDNIVLELNKLSNIKELQSDLSSYKKSIELDIKLSTIGSYISYILSQNGVSNDKEIEILDKILSFKREIYSELGGVVNLKEDIIKKAIINDKTISQLAWEDDFKKILSNRDIARRDILKKIEKRIETISINPNSLIKNIALAVLFFILFIYFAKKLSQISSIKEIKRSKEAFVGDAVIGKKSDFTTNINDKKELSKFESDDIDSVDIVLKSSKKESSKDKEIKKDVVLRAFNPLVKFANVAKVLSKELDSKDISFKYSIEEDIPTHSLSNVTKIDEILSIIVDHILDQQGIDNIIEYEASIVAQNMTQSAVNLRFFIKNDKVEFDTNRLKRLTHYIGADFKDIYLEDRSREIFVTFNLKK